MPRPRPLQGPEAARGTLAHRLTHTADRLRQFNTRFGLRSRRVFLVWVAWTGEERGEGEETELARRELLPTPRVSDATALTRRATAEGVLSDGQLRVDQISAGAYTEDDLAGRTIPASTTKAPHASPAGYSDGTRAEPRVAGNVGFWYEVVEDGRGDPTPVRTRYRLATRPSRNEGGLYWTVVLEAAHDNVARTGDSNFERVQVDDDL